MFNTKGPLLTRRHRFYSRKSKKNSFEHSSIEMNFFDMTFSENDGVRTSVYHVNRRTMKWMSSYFSHNDVWYPPKLIISQQSRKQEKKENLITETSEPDDNRTSLRTRQYSFASAKFHLLSHTSVIKLRTETRKLHPSHSEINFFLILTRNPNKSDGLAFSLTWSHNK